MSNFFVSSILILTMALFAFCHSAIAGGDVSGAALIDETQSRRRCLYRCAGWAVETKPQGLGHYSDCARAITAAMELANSAGKAGRRPDVIMKGEGPLFQALWTYGEHLYPNSPGKPKIGRALGTYRMP